MLRRVLTDRDEILRAPIESRLRKNILQLAAWAALGQIGGTTMPDINPEKVCFIIVKARELESEDEGMEPDASNPADDKCVSVMTEEAFSTVRAELSEFINAMDQDEQCELVALAWIGRGDFTSQEWDAALEQARLRRQGSTSEYLLGVPLLASYLEDGLSEFGENCENYAANRQ
jgi:hypothetical protein